MRTLLLALIIYILYPTIGWTDLVSQTCAFEQQIIYQSDSSSEESSDEEEDEEEDEEPECD